MAGLQHLFDIYSKQGKEFIDGLFNKSLIVSEKPDGSVFSAQKREDGGMDFFKRDDRQPISKLDRTIMSLYEPPIEYIEGKSEGKKIPTNLRFGFEYFQNTKPVAISYDRLPKNGLVLTHMKEIDDKGKVSKFIDEPKILNKWAKYFGVEEPFIIFDGKLSQLQKEQLEAFLETPFGDLVSEFKTSSFTKYIVSILNPKLKKTALNNTLDKPIEGLVFKFNDGEYLAKVVDPMFTQMARDKALERNNKPKGSSDEFGLVLYTFITWLEEHQILQDFIADGKNEDEKYVDLMTRVAKRFIDENKIFLKGLSIKKPDFAKAPEFSLNTKMIKSKEVVDFVKKNKESEEIFRILLSGFRKTRKRKTNMIDANLMKQINSVVAQIKVATTNTNESFLSFSDWKKTL
tara:strand:+ start:2429 stop:3634 length:1206 start_codon:yes stop_codon:yes gene_type:complete